MEIYLRAISTRNLRMIRFALCVITLFQLHSQLQMDLARAENVNLFPGDSCEVSWKEAPEELYLYPAAHIDPSQKNQPRIASFAARDPRSYSYYTRQMMEKGLIRRNCHKTWTVLVYMAVTQDLQPYSYADLVEMETTIRDQIPGSSKRTDVLVSYSSEKDSDIRRLHIFPVPGSSLPVSTREDLALLNEAVVQSPLVSSLDKKPIESEQKRFEDFLKWGALEYPSEHYLVIVWGHGQGWTAISSQKKFNPQDRNPNSRDFGGLGLQKNGGYLDIPSLNRALRAMSATTGSPIDVFASDACLMQSTETIAEVSENTQYVCGSEDIESRAGFPYGKLLSELNSAQFGRTLQSTLNAANRGFSYYDEPRLVAWMIPQLYKEAYDPKDGIHFNLDPNAHEDLTQCSISSKHLRTALIPSLNELGTALIQYTQEVPEKETLRRGSFLALIERGNGFVGGMQDLGDFTHRLTLLISEQPPSPATLSLRTALQKLQIALKYTVVHSVQGENYLPEELSTLSDLRGISIWLPRSPQEFKVRVKDFAQSALYRSGQVKLNRGWYAWVGGLYNTGWHEM